MQRVLRYLRMLRAVPISCEKMMIGLQMAQNDVKSVQSDVKALQSHLEALVLGMSRQDSQLSQMAAQLAALGQQAPSTLAARASLASLIHAVAPTASKPVPAPLDSAAKFDEVLARLETRFPTAYKYWYELLLVAEREYAANPPASLSVRENVGATWFQRFLSLHRRGTVLDIGCGPASVPTYLADVPLESIAGIDPVIPKRAHPFTFVQAIAESIPWPDASFDTVVAATSLDHVLVPELVFEEIRRVVAPGGRFVVWAGFVRGAKPYDPVGPDISPIDDFHLFHFDEDWFEALLTKHFSIEEKAVINGGNWFYSCRPD